ncbi:MAG: phospholipid/cholesterol/gamma-HCH transport system permease protein [Glaciecola sp.]|jgi:phospholipid/cholesterol/gamma-HCH transport system permease protein
MKLFIHIGRYGLLLKKVFGKREKASIYWQRIIEEMEEIGVKSIGLVALMSLFVGAVITLQTASNIDNPLIPIYLVGFATRESIILEFSPTMLSLILAGKVGSKIASELGNMRISEQIDAIEIMGVNSAGYLIFPKIVAAVITFPLLIIMSMTLGMVGGWIVSVGSSLVSSYDYVYGIHYDFKVFNVVYALVKTLFFAFIITSVSAYYGYFVKGGSLEVGQSSTSAVVSSSVVILIVNYLLTQMMLI